MPIHEMVFVSHLYHSERHFSAMDQTFFRGLSFYNCVWKFHLQSGTTSTNHEIVLFRLHILFLESKS
jgi:hypothetical protein